METEGNDEWGQERFGNVGFGEGRSREEGGPGAGLADCCLLGKKEGAKVRAEPRRAMPFISLLPPTLSPWGSALGPHQPPLWHPWVLPLCPLQRPQPAPAGTRLPPSTTPTDALLRPSLATSCPSTSSRHCRGGFGLEMAGSPSVPIAGGHLQPRPPTLHSHGGERGGTVTPFVTQQDPRGRPRDAPAHLAPAINPAPISSRR